MKFGIHFTHASVLLYSSVLLAAPQLKAANEMFNPPEDHPVENAAKFRLQVKRNPALPTLYLVGDSTMKVGTKEQRGWGDEVAPFFNLEKINVVNEAIGGRSSRTYQTEGRWNALLAMVLKGDYVIVEFGHNDAGPINENESVPPEKRRARGTIKGVGEETKEVDNIITKQHEVVHSYGWYMRKYVNDIKAKGATPIVMSLTPRNNWDGATQKVIRASGENYGGWASQAAQSTGAIFVDHNEIIGRKMDALGQDTVKQLFSDGVHVKPEGAKLNAEMAVSGLKAIPGNPFGAYFSEIAASVPTAPASLVKANSEASNGMR